MGEITVDGKFQCQHMTPQDIICLIERFYCEIDLKKQKRTRRNTNTVACRVCFSFLASRC